MMQLRRVPRGTAQGTPVTAEGARRLLGLVRPYRRRMLLAALCFALSSLSFLALPWGVRNIVDSVLVRRDAGLLNAVVAGLVALLLIQAVLGYFQTFLLSWVGERVVADLRVTLFSRLTRLPLGYYNERKTGELMSRITNDAALIQGSVTNNLLSVLSQFVVLLGAVAIMLLTDWRLSLVIVGVLPPIAVFARVFGGRLRRISRATQDELGASNAMLEEALSAIRVVKAFGRERYEGDRYAAVIERTFGLALSRASTRAVFIPLMTLLGFSAVVVVLWYGGRRVLARELTPGELIGMLIYMLLIIGPIGSIATLYSQLAEALGAAERIFEVLDEAPEPEDRPGAIVLPDAAGRVELRDVSFAYPGGADVLREVSLRAEPGEVVALVGRSGAGKTTLVNLIPRFYEPRAGDISFDGHPLDRIALDSLRGRISLVPQETVLFGASVRENIAYGRLDATREEIEGAARAANAHEFVRRLPQGYDTLVGERGVKLSAGQRQRIAIARALLRDAPVLILDEATAALDNESEALVQEALERLMLGRTTLVIAHRLSTVERADRILVLDGGRIVEEGTHDQLLSLEGLYYRLYTRSFFTDPARATETVTS